MYPAADSVRKDIALAVRRRHGEGRRQRQARRASRSDVIKKRQDQGATVFGYGTPVRPRPRALRALPLEVRDRRPTPTRTTRAPATRRSTARSTTRAPTLDAGRRARSRRAPAGRAREGRELAVARAPAPRRRDLQARQRRRPAGRAARARLLARDVVEPRGLDAGAGAMRRARPAQARAAAADPARRRRGNVRSRRGLALRPGRRLRRRGVAGEPGAAARRSPQAWGFDQSLPERFGRWIANVAQGDLGNSVVAGGQPVAARDRRARRRARRC